MSTTGYGPRQRLYFNGDENKYELWEAKFLGYMRLQKLYTTIFPKEGDEPNADKNAEVFAELIQCLDDRSLALVLRDANDDGKGALNILRRHYLGTGKPRILSLYTELTSLKMSPEEPVTDYVIRAETAAAALRSAGETVSDSLLIAMVLKGLPVEFKTFSTIITQRETDITFSAFKAALRSHEESEKATAQSKASNSDNVMNCNQKSTNPITCYSCGKPGHKANNPICKNADKKKQKFKPTGKGRWCEHCKTKTHNTVECRKKPQDKQDSAKTATASSAESSHTFVFKVTVDVNSVNTDHVNQNALLVDTGATAHIIKDKEKFIDFTDNFRSENHYIELADGSKSSGMVEGKGTACVFINDENGNDKNITLQNALYIPTYKQNIFSVQRATGKGATVNFAPDSAEMKAPDGTKFPISKHKQLYYLNNVAHKTGSHSVDEWHKILGHCNVNDIFSLENVVEGMKITNKRFTDCIVCIEGKMTKYRNRDPDKKATEPLKLVHTDLAGPLDPVAIEGFRYAISFIDDYSGVIFIYFLKQKSDTLLAAEKFLADSAPYGKVKTLRSDNGGEYTSSKFKSLMRTNKIKQEFSAPHSPHQNGTAERGWRSLFEMARCMLLESDLPKNLWTYAVMASVYIRNRCYNPRLDKTPFEAFTGIKPNLSNMHPFGTSCYAYIEEHKSKLDARCNPGYLCLCLCLFGL